MTVKYGFKGTINNNTGSYGTPTWSAISNVRDVMVNADPEKFDASTRAGNGIKQYEPTLIDLGVTGKIRSDETDTNGFVAIETAFLTRASMDLMILDGAATVSGSRGYRFDAKVFKFGEDQNLGGVNFREFEFAPCVSANAPSKAVVTTGSPVFTAL
jgi:hypothetical protein